MIRALWFLLKLVLLALAAGWLAAQPGSLHAEWRGYAVETSVGFLAAALLVFLAVYTLAYRMYRRVVSVPAVLRRYEAARKRDLGYRDMTSGFVAVAAGDADAARKYALRARKLVPDAPLALLLEAQSCLLSGEAPRARRIFADLLDKDDTAFLGLRGLLQEALQANDDTAALGYIRRASDLQPKRLWVLRTRFDLECRNKAWAQAEQVLNRAARLGVFSGKDTARHRQAILLARADAAFSAARVVDAHKLAAKAFRADASFIPAALRLVRYYRHVGKSGAALKAIEAAWRAMPHPDLGALWMEAQPVPKKPLSVYDAGKDAFDWAQRLAAFHPNHRDSLRLLGNAATEAHKFSLAREMLTRAADFRGLAKLERAETGNEAKARAWLEAAAEAPPEPKWNCSACGHAALDWNPSCWQCGSFNTLGWHLPGDHASGRQDMVALLPPGM